MSNPLASELGAFPPDWRIHRFDSIFSVQQGKQVSKKTREGNSQHPFLRTRNVFWGHLDMAELDEMHFTKTEESRLALQPGDLLVCEGRRYRTDGDLAR